MSETSRESGSDSKTEQVELENNVCVKLEISSNEDDPVVSATMPTTNNSFNEFTQQPETNNNGCGDNETIITTDMGPVLRSSKIKTRNSDSSSETGEDVKPSLTVVNKSCVTIDTVDPLKTEQRNLNKSNEMKNNNPVAQNISSGTSKSRRSSVATNVETKKNPVTNEKFSGKELDDMVNQIKFNISKAIESKVMFKPEIKGPTLMNANFDVLVDKVFGPHGNNNESSTSSTRTLGENTSDEESSNASAKKRGKFLLRVIKVNVKLLFFFFQQLFVN